MSVSLRLCRYAPQSSPHRRCPLAPGGQDCGHCPLRVQDPQTCFRLPHCFGHFVACSLARPPALRDADYRLAPVIVLPLWKWIDAVMLLQMTLMLMLLPVVALSFIKVNRSTGACVVILLLGLLLYMEILRLFIIPAFGEILSWWYAKVSARPPLSSTHYGLQRPCSAEEESVSSGRFVVLRPPKPPCWGYSAPLCRQSRQRRATGC